MILIAIYQYYLQFILQQKLFINYVRTENVHIYIYKEYVHNGYIYYIHFYQKSD